MTTVIANSALLSLSSLLLPDDEECLPAGAHFRWAISPDLGFPHAGFRLRMRMTPTWPWPEDQRKTVLFSRNNVAASTAGVHISDAPVRVSEALVTDRYSLTCDDAGPMRFCYEQREREEPLFAPWVRFAVILRKRATTSAPSLPAGPIRPPFDIRPLPRLQGRVGPVLTPIKPTAAVEPATTIKPAAKLDRPFVIAGGVLKKVPDINVRGDIGDILRPAPAAGPRVDIKGVGRRDGQDVVVAERSARFDDLPYFHPGKPNERVAIISGDELHAVTAELDEGLEVIGIAYCAAQQVHDAAGWKTMAWQQPLCTPGTANVAAPADANRLASERLKAMRPLRRPAHPDFDPAGLPLSQTDHANFEARVLNDVDRMAGAIANAFRMEIEDKIPPGRVTVADVDDSASASSDEGSMDFPFHGLLQAGAFADHVAAILGLGFYSKFTADPTKQFDFQIEAIVPAVWLSVAGMSSQMRASLDLSRIPTQLITAGGKREVFDNPPPGFVRLVAFNINRVFAAPQPVSAPAVTARTVPDPSRSSVQARVSIELVPQVSGLRPLLRRDGDNGPVPIGPVDPATKLLVPMLANHRGMCRAGDNDLPRYGTIKYRAINIDSFGRASDPEHAATLVEDKSPPVAPGRPVIHPGDPSASDPDRFPDVTASFDWTDAMAAASPDVVKFHLLWKRGSVDAAAVEAQPDGSTSMAWPAQPSQKVETFAGGSRFINAVDIRAQRSGHRHEWTMVCLAEDAAGNVSPPSSPAHQVVVEPVMPPPPVQPPEPQWTAWPDATGDARHRMHWTVPSGAAGTRISSASEGRILKLAGADLATHLAHSPGERADALKALAVDTPNAFVPEAPVYPAASTSHDIVLKAGSRDYRVVLVEFISETGQKSPWPERQNAFAVVRARPKPVLAAPTIRVARDNDAFLLSASTSEIGTVEIFALTDPAQVKDIAVMHPVGTISAADGETVRHIPSVPAAHASRWVGYACRLLLDNNQKSPLSDIVWREMALLQA